jgi:uncharacterized membrane protein YjjP (DUF1212 family)
MNYTAQSIQNENALLVSAILDIGEILLVSGAEVSRVEDTMNRIGEAYHFSQIDILTITSSMIFTVHTEDGEIITQTRRIHSTQINMEKLDRMNALSREICKNPLPIEELRMYIKSIENAKQYPNRVRLLAYAMISGAFTMFFGGRIVDAAASMITGVLLYFIIRIGNKMKIQSMVLNMISSFATGILAVVVISLGIGISFDKIIIGNIMLLIPGIALTSSIRDVIKGDIISGILGLSEALLRALAIAIGFALVIMIRGGN